MKFKSDIEVQAGLKDSSGSAGTSGKILSSTGTGVAWVDDNPGISGSGTTNYISKFTGTTTLGNSLLFDNGTNIGIGTTSPTLGKLVSKDSSYQFIAEPTDTATYGYLGIGQFTNGAFIGTTAGTNSASDILRFGTGGAEKMRITSSGNVGIGTTSPNGQLDVYNSPYQRLAIIYPSTYLTKLEIGGNSYIQQDAANEELRIAQGYGSGKITFSTNATEKMRITSAGNVGIGTTSPNEKLTVSGKIYANPQQPVVLSGQGAPYYGTNITLASDIGSTQGANRIWSRYDGTGSGAITFERSTNSQAYNSDPQLLTYTESMRIAGNGNVGIGTSSPNSTLSVGSSDAGAVITSGGANTHLSLKAMGSAGELIFGAGGVSNGTAGSERMRINSAGNVGIGTSSPSYKTDISGNLRFSTGYLNSDNCFERVFSQAISFPNGTANLAADVILGNISFWGYIEVEITATYSNQSSGGKLTKIFAVGTNPNNLIYINESRVADSMGTVPDNVAVGDMSWDATNSRYRIPISHIVSTGNSYTVKVRMFTSEATASVGARAVFNSISIGSNYTLTALARQYPYYNSRLGIGTASPNSVLNVSATAGASIPALGAASSHLAVGNATNYGTMIGTLSSGVGYIQQQRFDGTATAYNLLLQPNGGNVGIGTTSPAVKLHLLASSENEIRVQESTNNAFISLYQQSTTSYLIAGRTGATPTQDLSIYTGGGEKMRILSNGNVGIGTSTPQRKLDVVSGANNFVSVGISQMSVGQWAGIGFGYAEGSNNLYRKSAIVFERTDLTSNNAQGKVHILNGPQGNANSATLSDSKLTIAENGNVGIGTTSPGAKLDVNGDALINQLTIGQGPVVGQGNTALGKGALGSMVGGKANIAVGSNANSDNDVTGLTVIGVDLNVNPAGSALTQNSLVIGQYNALNYSTQYPHIYAPDKVNCPNGNTTTDVIAVDYSIYTAIFMEYSIFNSAGDQFRAGTYTAAFKGTGTVIEDDNQTVVYSGTTLAATFTTSVTGNVVTIQLRNQDSDTYDIRVTARLLMR